MRANRASVSGSPPVPTNAITVDACCVLGRRGDVAPQLHAAQQPIVDEIADQPHPPAQVALSSTGARIARRGHRCRRRIRSGCVYSRPDDDRPSEVPAGARPLPHRRHRDHRQAGTVGRSASRSARSPPCRSTRRSSGSCRWSPRTAGRRSSGRSRSASTCCGADQGDLCWQFAKSGVDDPFDGVSWTPGAGHRLADHRRRDRVDRLHDRGRRRRRRPPLRDGPDPGLRARHADSEPPRCCSTRASSAGSPRCNSHPDLA